MPERVINERIPSVRSIYRRPFSCETKALDEPGFGCPENKLFIVPLFFPGIASPCSRPAPGLITASSSCRTASAFKNSSPLRTIGQFVANTRSTKETYRIRKNSSRSAALRLLALYAAKIMSPTTGTRPTPALTALLASILRSSQPGISA